MLIAIAKQIFHSALSQTLLGVILCLVLFPLITNLFLSVGAGLYRKRNVKTIIKNEYLLCG